MAIGSHELANRNAIVARLAAIEELAGALPGRPFSPAPHSP